MRCQVTFQPMGRKITCDAGTTIQEAANGAGIALMGVCGGGKKCGKCKVCVPEQTARLSELSQSEKRLLSAEEMKKGIRLACCAQVAGNCRVIIPEESHEKKTVIMEDGVGGKGQFKPAVRIYRMKLDRPTLEDHRDDLKRIQDGVHVQNAEVQSLVADYPLLCRIPDILRKSRFSVTAVVYNNRKLIGLFPGKDKRVFGMAVDVGTTTLAAYLCDLETGTFLDKASAVNPQIRFGDDVLSRVSYCMMEEDGLARMQKILIGTINDLAEKMLARQQAGTDDLAETVLVFNTVMEHLTLGIRPDALGVSPFIPSTHRGLTLRASDVGLEMMEGGRVYALPSEAGFVGADNVAVLIAQEPYNQEKVQLIIDIGTNGELCLGNREALYVTSCATGPALEGAQIKCGMRAAQGAVEKVRIDRDSLEPELGIIGVKGWVTDDSRALGLCGSGIIDGVAQMAAAGIIDEDGHFLTPSGCRRIRWDENGKMEYVLSFGGKGQDLVITQKDVRDVQLAKAALYSGAKILLKKSPFEKIDEIVLAGAFGSYIDVSNALLLGLFPDCVLADIKSVGNAAGVGAKLALLDVDKRKEAEAIAQETHFIETATEPDFYTEFGDAMAIPHKKDCFTANLTGRFPCSGVDDRKLPQKIREKAPDIFDDGGMMAEAAIQIQIESGWPAVRLPLTMTTETEIFGGSVIERDGIRLPSGYVLENADDLKDFIQAKPDGKPISRVMEAVKKMKGRPVVLDVQAPFSVLASLMDVPRLCLMAQNEESLVQGALEKITDFLADYLQQAIDAGVRIISLGDSSGVMELTGPEFYRRFSGKATWDLMNRLIPRMKTSAFYLCGKVAVSMEKAELMIKRPVRMDDDLDFVENILQMASDKKVRIICGGCINTVRKASVVYSCRLTEKSGDEIK